MQKERELFEKAPVVKALATLAVPTIISQLITMIYNLADTFFIGTTNDDSKIAASSVSFVLVFGMACFSNLFGVGGGSLISRLLGEKRDSDAERVSSFSFYGSILAGLIYSTLMFIFMDPILRTIGATDSSIGFARDYAFWVIVIGAAPSTVAVTMSHLLRSVGYAKQASIGLGMGGVLNILLDPLFMFVILEPGQEVAGAALATMLSNVAVLVYFLVIFFMIRKKTVLSISPKKVLPSRAHIGAVFAVGFPSAIGTLFACLSNTVINKLASGYTDAAVAAIGVAKKIDMLPMNVGMGLCQGMMPLVAYNYAAGNYKRMKAFSDAARTAGIAFAALCLVAFEIFAEPLVRIFINTDTAVPLGIDFLRILCVAVPLMILNFQMNFTFQAMGMGRESLILSSMRQGIVNIPLLFVMNHFFGLYGIVWTQLISDLITTAMSVILYRRSYMRLTNSVQTDTVENDG